MPLLRSPRGTAVLLLAAVLITFGLLQIGRQTIAVVYTGIGLFFYQRVMIVEDEVEVAPRGRELVRGNLKAEAFSTFSSSLASPRKGEGIEFADIREYTYGDPYKRIEWKSTARTGELMVRELYAET